MLTILLSLAGTPVLRLLGASGEVFTIGRDYLTVIILGAVLQIMGTGLVPILRNLGGAACATVFMILGFAANILGDYLLVWQFDMGAPGAAVATIVGQGATMTATIGFLIKKKRLYFSLPKNKTGIFFRNIILVDIAPFGVSLTPNFSLIPINRFSVFYGRDI
ncbi:MAG: hypothetical protein LUD14_00025 [Clostridiales bacterium]|nr:hypothetical protein [Clostridiales bacterium]